MFMLSLIIIAIVAGVVLSKVCKWDETKMGAYITVAILVIIAVGFIRFERWALDDTGYDDDHDGLSNDFEVEQGTDPGDYTWNFELDN